MVQTFVTKYWPNIIILGTNTPETEQINENLVSKICTIGQGPRDIFELIPPTFEKFKLNLGWGRTNF